MLSHTKREELRNKFKIFSLQMAKSVADGTSNHSYTESLISNFWLKVLDEELENLSKAYGGCTKCYGKGYFTNLDGWSGTDEDTGQRYSKQTPYYNPCTCDRGKQFKEAINIIHNQ